MRLADHTYLFTITDRFAIEGRGVVVVPGIPWDLKTTVRKGDPLIIRTPLGDILERTLQDIEMISYRPGGRRLEATPFSLPKDIHKFDIPIGTEVYLPTSPASSTNSEQDAPSNGG
jgi:hypothetical protein